MKREDIQIRDPFVLVDEGVYYFLGSTGDDVWNAGSDLYLYKTVDLENFEFVNKMVDEKTFENFTGLWAPELHKYKGKYYLIISVRNQALGRGCIILTANSLTEKFTFLTGEYITPSYMQCLDATLFEYNGKPYLCFADSWDISLTDDGDGALFIAELSQDLTKMISKPKKVVSGKYCGFAKMVSYPGAKGYVAEGNNIVLLWSTIAKDGYCVVKSISKNGVFGDYEVEKFIFTEDGGHCMSFIDLNGKRKIILHQPNDTPNERAQIFDYK